MEPTFFRPVVDDLSAYRDAMRRAEENAVAVVVDEFGRTPEGAVPTEEPTAVPVQASDQPLPPVETPGTEETAVSEETPVVEPVVVEETPEQRIARLEAELQQREAQLAEKETMIGRQSAEVGEVRAEIAQLREELATRTPQAPAVAPVAITSEMIFDDPAGATILAYNQNDAHALERAFEVWKEQDSFTAASWRSDTLAQQREAALRADLQRQLEEHQAREQAVAAANNAWNEAMGLVKAKHADFLAVDPATGKSHAERLLTEVAPQYPHLIAVLRDGNAQAKAEVLEALYVVDRANHTDPNAVRAQLEEAAAQAAAEEAASRAAAATVVGQPTVGQPPIEETAEQREQKAYVARRAAAPSLEHGWTRLRK